MTNLIITTSTVTDGSMLDRNHQDDPDIIENRRVFLAKNNISLHEATRVRVEYVGDDYCRYYEVSTDNKGQGMLTTDVVTADALITRVTNHALFLPLADCVGAVIYDPRQKILMVSHLGRHSIEQNGGYNSVRFLVDNYASNPSELLVWLTPAPGVESYPVWKMDNRGLKELTFEQLETAGVIKDNITDDPTDTAKDENYFSYSEFLKGNRKLDGRYAIVAMITD